MLNYLVQIPEHAQTSTPLREDAKFFPNLKQISLVDGGSASSAHIRGLTPGIVKLVDLSQVKQDAPWGMAPGLDPFQLQAEFLEQDLTETERRDGIPDVQVVGAIFIPTLPGDDWERDYGEPYVRLSSFNCICTLLTYIAVSSKDCA